MKTKSIEMNMQVKRWALYLGIMIMLCMAGCAATQQPRGPISGLGVQESGFLKDLYPLMKEGGEGQSLRVYFNPRVEFLPAEAYDKVLLNAVTIYLPPESETRKVPQEKLQQLADLFAGQLSQELSKDYQLVKEPGPKTLRIDVALTDVMETRTNLKALSFVPAPALPGAKFAGLRTAEYLTGKPVFAGEATAEVKMTDAESGDVLFAAMDRRVGTRLGGGWKSWTDAEQAFRYWAQKVRYGLATQLRHQTDAIPPKE